MQGYPRRYVLVSEENIGACPKKRKNTVMESTDWYIISGEKEWLNTRLPGGTKYMILH